MLVAMASLWAATYIIRFLALGQLVSLPEQPQRPQQQNETVSHVAKHHAEKERECDNGEYSCREIKHTYSSVTHTSILVPGFTSR